MTFPYRQKVVPVFLSSPFSSSFLLLCSYRFILAAVFSTLTQPSNMIPYNQVGLKPTDPLGEPCLPYIPIKSDYTQWSFTAKRPLSTPHHPLHPSPTHHHYTHSQGFSCQPSPLRINLNTVFFFSSICFFFFSPLENVIACLVLFV